MPSDVGDITFSINGICEYHRTALPRLRYVDPESICSTLDTVIDKYDVKHIAPSHGPLIEVRDYEAFIEKFELAIERISDEYVVPRPND